jgi:hypothetical protein
MDASATSAFAAMLGMQRAARRHERPTRCRQAVEAFVDSNRGGQIFWLLCILLYTVIVDGVDHLIIYSNQLLAKWDMGPGFDASVRSRQFKGSRFASLVEHAFVYFKSCIRGIQLQNVHVQFNLMRHRRPAEYLKRPPGQQGLLPKLMATCNTRNRAKMTGQDVWTKCGEGLLFW